MDNVNDPNPSATHTPDPTSPKTSPNDWYAQGRAYSMSVLRAVVAAASLDGAAAALHEQAADRRLWLLHNLSADELRDFIAGGHRQAEVHLAEVRAKASTLARDPDPRSRPQIDPAPSHSKGTGESAALDEAALLAGARINQVFAGISLDFLPIEYSDLIDRLMAALASARKPPRRREGFAELAICEYAARNLRAYSDDPATDETVLDRVFDVIAVLLTTANREDLEAFIQGQRFAHVETQ